MSTTTPTATSVATPHPELDGHGLPFARLVHVELRKQVDTRAGRGLLLVVLALTALAVGLVMWFSRHDGASMRSLLTATTTPQGLLLPILGIVTACNEWSQRTALVTFTQEPRRLRVVSAKAVAAVALGTVAVVAAWLLAALAHVCSASLAGARVDLSVSATALAGTWLLQVVAVLQGVAFGLALLSVPLAIAATFVLPTLVTMVAALWPPLARLGAWIDMAQASEVLGRPAWPTPHQWEQLGTCVLLWVALPLAVGGWRVVHREVK